MKYPYQIFAASLLSFLISGSVAFGQRGCATLEYHNQHGMAGTAGSRAFEEWIQQAELLENDKHVQDNDELYYIPVVVHVLHNGEPVGTDKNLSLERILSQIEILNNDYSKAPGTPGFNTQAAGADTRIRFCLASVDPNGQPTSGIVRVNTNRDAFDFNTDNATLKGLSIWDPNRYLNLWSVKFSSTQYIGYAQYPFTDSIPMPQPIPDVQPDGVVIEYRVFGDVPAGQSGPFPSYNKGRTATHEIGHYLGLLHIWGDGFGCPDINGTDYCEDTPKQANFTAGCPASVNSCNTGVPAMFQNYMDYTNDACMNVFTKDQKRRMRIVMRNAPRRKTLFTTPTQCGVSGVGDLAKQIPFTLYPSPAQDELKIQVTEHQTLVSYSVSEITGRTLFSQPALGSAGTIHIGALPAGVYNLSATDASGKIWHRKFVKQ